MPADCSILNGGALLFSWGEPDDRAAEKPFKFNLRGGNGAPLASLADLAVPRLILETPLAPGDYQWSVIYIDRRGLKVSTQWRRFSVLAPPVKPNRTANMREVAAASGPPVDIPDGQAISLIVEGRERPRLVPAGSSLARIKVAAQGPDHLPVLNALRTNALVALQKATAVEPVAAANANSTERAQFGFMVHRTAVTQRQDIEVLALIGRIDGDSAMRDSAKQKLLYLAEWDPTGVSSEHANDHANRELYTAIATGLDLLWDVLTSQERAKLIAAARIRVLDASTALSFLDHEPYESHRLVNVRGINQALMLLTGAPGFPEASSLLVRTWNLSRFTLSAWGEKDGTFGNGIAYAWYAFTSTVPYVAATRTISGVNLYDRTSIGNLGNQLIAFTAPNHPNPSAFGDGSESLDLYRYFAANHFRLHAQMTRSPVDAWYWQANPLSYQRPNQPLIWQLLLLGVDDSPLPPPQAPSQHSWFFHDAGLAAMHADARESMRTSLFFRSSRFGAFNHSHADQNSVVYVSRGQPLLINAGYYPYYNSPHHKAISRATRYKNALTFDGGFGQSESSVNAPRPTEPVHSMDASGMLVAAEERGPLTFLTGDATAAYRSINPKDGSWAPLLTNAVRSVLMDRVNGVVLIYDWATSAVPRQWELNYHSPSEFTVDGDTVIASNNGASVCLDRHGPASSFAQTMAWEIEPEVKQPEQAHGRFSMLRPSTEFAHLTVLRDGCRVQPVHVQRSGTQFQVRLGGQRISFDKRTVRVDP
jgi:hypothetical protein